MPASPDVYRSDEDEDYTGKDSDTEEQPAEEKKERKRLKKAKIDSDDEASNADSEESEGEDVMDDDGRICDPDEASALKKLEDKEEEESAGLIVDSDDPEVERDEASMKRRFEKQKRKDEDKFEKNAKNRLKEMAEEQKQAIIAEFLLKQQKAEKAKKDEEELKKQKEKLKNQMDVVQEDPAKLKKMEAQKKFGKRQRADSDNEDDSERSIGDSLSKVSTAEKAKQSKSSGSSSASSATPKMVQTPLVMSKVKPEEMFKEDDKKTKKPAKKASQDSLQAWKIGESFVADGIKYVLTYVSSVKASPPTYLKQPKTEEEWANSQKLDVFSTCCSAPRPEVLIKLGPRDRETFKVGELDSMPAGMRWVYDDKSQKHASFYYCVVPDSKDSTPVLVTLDGSAFAAATKNQESKADKQAISLNLYSSKAKDEGTKGRGERVTRPWTQYNIDTNIFSVDKKSGDAEYIRLRTHPELAAKKFFDNVERKAAEKRKKEAESGINGDDTPADSDDDDAPDVPPLKKSNPKDEKKEEEKKALEKAAAERKAAEKPAKSQKRKADSTPSSDKEAKQVKFEDDKLRKVIKEVVDESLSLNLTLLKEFTREVFLGTRKHMDEGDNFRRNVAQALSDLSIRLQSVQQDMVTSDKLSTLTLGQPKKHSKKTSAAAPAPAPIPVAPKSDDKALSATEEYKNAIAKISLAAQTSLDSAKADAASSSGDNLADAWKEL